VGNPVWENLCMTQADAESKLAWMQEKEAFNAGPNFRISNFHLFIFCFEFQIVIFRISNPISQV
jgi:hypothetical protein